MPEIKASDEIRTEFSDRGHPKGLYVLFATEMWERFNYYGMRAILIFYMTQALVFNDAFASNLYGSYIGLIYLSALLGGYIADRFWGNRRSIIIGGLVMAVGEFILFYSGTIFKSNVDLSTFMLFLGLGFMIAGNGFFKPNISSMVGQLYPKGDRRIDPAYTIFYMGINIGGALGPLACGLVGQTGNPADFKWAFLVGGIGMLISVVVQLLFQDKYVRSPEGALLGTIPTKEVKEAGVVKTVNAAPKAWFQTPAIIIGMILLSFFCMGILYVDAKVFSFMSYLLIVSVLYIAFVVFFDKTLTRAEKERVGVIFVVSFFVIFFWAAYEQTGASLNLFAERQTDRQLGSYTIPASFFQSLNSIFVIIFAPAFAFLWLKMGKREPSAPTKMALGLLLLALGYWWIAYGVSTASSGAKVSMIWLFGMYALHTWGELSLSPIGLSLVNKLSPLKFSSLLMAVWFLSNAAGNKLAGVLSSLFPGEKPTSFLGYQMKDTYDFFMLFVFMGGIAALILFLLSKRLKRMMHMETRQQ
ncbi:MAG TPA: peptide MFS transporter [Flavisolibacter sp.]|nr:peptide MFS transporter [Flavisolibacter sp.]